MEHIIKQLKQYGVNLIYEKKKHFNAADRKRKDHTRISIINAAINVISSSVLIFFLCTTGNTGFIITSLVIALTSAILTAIQEILKLNIQADGHAKVGNECLRVIRQICLSLALSADGKIDDEELLQRSDQILNAISEINSSAQQLSTSKNDYKKAHDGIESGEEGYSEEEFKLLEC
jgi:hypothetical protein